MTDDEEDLKKILVFLRADDLMKQADTYHHFGFHNKILCHIDWAKLWHQVQKVKTSYAPRS